MNKNKNLYAIGFEHPDPLKTEDPFYKPNKRIDYNALILADLIKIIGENQNITRFFGDGIDKITAQNMQYIVDYMTKLKNSHLELFIKNLISEVPQYGEEPRMYQSLAQIKKKGIDIKVCQTEVNDFDKPLNFLERVIEDEIKNKDKKFIKTKFKENMNKTKIIIKELKDELEQLKADEFAFIMKLMNHSQFIWIAEKRDEYIYKNFLEYSDKENLLCIGRLHSLKPFMQDNMINFYRTDILINKEESNPNPEDITLNGNLPVSLKSQIDLYLKGCGICNEIKYKK